MAEGRGLMSPLLVVNLVVFLIILGLASWSLDKYIDGEQTHPHLGGNPSIDFMLMFALLSGVLGVCSVLSGFAHLRARRNESPANGASVAFVASAITALAFGLPIKEIILGGHRGKRLRTLEAFIIISLLIQVLYLGLLLAGLFSWAHGCGYALYGSR